MLEGDSQTVCKSLRLLKLLGSKCQNPNGLDLLVEQRIIFALQRRLQKIGKRAVAWHAAHRPDGPRFLILGKFAFRQPFQDRRGLAFASSHQFVLRINPANGEWRVKILNELIDRELFQRLCIQQCLCGRRILPSNSKDTTFVD